MWCSRFPHSLTGFSRNNSKTQQSSDIFLVTCDEVDEVNRFVWLIRGDPHCHSVPTSICKGQVKVLLLVWRSTCLWSRQVGDWLVAVGSGFLVAAHFLPVKTLCRSVGGCRLSYFWLHTQFYYLQIAHWLISPRFLYYHFMCWVSDLCVFSLF